MGWIMRFQEILHRPAIDGDEFAADQAGPGDSKAADRIVLTSFGR
jgi:hypothetical protein